MRITTVFGALVRGAGIGGVSPDLHVATELHHDPEVGGRDGVTCPFGALAGSLELVLCTERACSLCSPATAGKASDATYICKPDDAES